MQNHVGAIDYLLKLPQLTSVYPGTIMLEKCTKDELLSLVKKQAAWPDVMHKQFEKYWISILPLLLSCKQKCEIRHHIFTKVDHLQNIETVLKKAR